MCCDIGPNLAHQGVDKDEVMDHLLMEQKLVAAPLDCQHGKLATMR